MPGAGVNCHRPVLTPRDRPWWSGKGQGGPLARLPSRTLYSRPLGQREERTDRAGSSLCR